MQELFLMPKWGEDGYPVGGKGVNVGGVGPDVDRHNHGIGDEMVMLRLFRGL